MSHKIITVKYRRKLEGKTDYKLRLKLLMSGKLRLVVRKSNSAMVAQIVQFSDKGDLVLVSAHTAELKKLGWTHATGNTPASYLLGLLIASKAKKKKVKECIFDIGLQKAVKGSRLFAVLKGAVDGGLEIAHSDEIFPSEDRIKGTHIKTESLFDQMKKKILQV